MVKWDKEPTTSEGLPEEPRVMLHCKEGEHRIKLIQNIKPVAIVLWLPESRWDDFSQVEEKRRNENINDWTEVQVSTLLWETIGEIICDAGAKRAYHSIANKFQARQLPH